MRTVTLLAVAAIAIAGAWAYARRDFEQVGEAAAEPGGWNPGSVDAALTSAVGSALDMVDGATGGILKLSRMRDVKPEMLNNQNVKALLMVIRTGEGTADAGGYSRLFGGGKFDSYADHPRVTVRKGGYVSTAAGAYQFLSSTWDETKRIMGLPDFSPHSQDLGALGRIAARGALDDAINGQLESALKKISKEWASMPHSPYGQPVISMQRAQAIFASAGGVTVYA